MALSAKISTVYIRQLGYTTGDWKYAFTTNNFVSELGQVNFNEAFDEAIDGSLRSNLRGYRLNVSLNWEKLLDSTVDRTINGTGTSNSTVGAFLNDLVTRLTTNGDDYVEISFDDTNWEKVIPENLQYATRYTNQIGRGSATLDFIGQEIITSIGAHLEAPSV